jgi:iron(III) transport system permease protein
MSAVLPLPSPSNSPSNSPSLPPAAALRQRAHWTDRIAHALMILIALALVVFLALPLGTILIKALEDRNGAFVGLINFTSYLATPSLLTSLWDSVWVSVLVTIITLPLCFGFAYALSRSRMPCKGLFRTIALVPLLAPSLLSALSLIYWFGNQGIARGFINALGFETIYGAPGIVVAECFAVFPHALMILITALSLADARL